MKRTPEAVHLQRRDRLVVQAELSPTRDLGELLQRPDAAGKRHERVGELEHEHLAVVHRIDLDQLTKALVGHLTPEDAAWDDADDATALGERGVGDDAHETDRTAAVHEGETLGRDAPADFRRDGRKRGVAARRRRAVNTDRRQLTHAPTLRADPGGPLLHFAAVPTPDPLHPIDPPDPIDAIDPIDPLAAFRLDGRVAVVTGASAGLGARFARVLDAAGARVVIAARRAERLEGLARTLRDPIVVPADITAPGAPETIISTAVESTGRLDVLVNNAGVTHVMAALEHGVDEFRRVLDVNLIAPFALARLAAGTMIDSGTGGSIVNVASIWGSVGVGQIPDAGYAASKGGLVNLTRELAAQWARRGVRVNALAPGWFRSEMTEGRMFGDEGAERWMRARTPMGRGGDEHELDGALLFLASDASSFVTGHTLVVDGGWTAV